MGKNMKKIGLFLLILILTTLLAACGESAPERPRYTSPAPQISPTSAATVLPSPTAQPTATEAVGELLPTATIPVAPPTAFPSPTPRTTIPALDSGLSLIAVRTTKVSFQTAYAKAVARMNGTNNAARFVMAQLTTFTREQSVWTFFFTLPRGNRSWAVLYDPIGTRDKKELITLTERTPALLPDDAGQIQVSRILDSDEISTRLEREGISPELPLDTVYLQLVTVSGQGRLPAYIFINGALNKQIIVNATTGKIIQNDFI
jgi:hypothetical protein